MDGRKPLFDDNISEGIGLFAAEQGPHASDKQIKKNMEGKRLHKLRDLDESIASAISRIKMLKESKKIMERQIRELEAQLSERDAEIERLTSEKDAVKSQINSLLNELEALDTE